MLLTLPLKHRVYRVFVSNSTALTLILTITSTLLGLGFLLGHGNNSNYTLVYAFAPAYLWGLTFLTYSVVKAGQALNYLSYWLKVTTSIMGLWLWSYLSLSFLWFDESDIAPTELMLLVTIFAELWTLAVLMYTKDSRNGTN